MICLTSPSRYYTLAALSVALLSVMSLPVVSCRTIEIFAKATDVDSRIVAQLQLTTESRPRWARFSPTNPHLLLLDIDAQGVLASLPEGTIGYFPKEMLPVGWLGESVIVRDQSGGFWLLDTNDLTPSSRVTLGSASLPWTFGKGLRLRFDIALPETTNTAIPSVIPGAEIKDIPVSTREEKADLSIDLGAEGHNVIDASGKIVFKGTQRIYGIVLSPNTYKLIVYYGNTEYVLFNRLTRRTVKLPTNIEAWTWLPDSATLLGQTSVGVDARFEEVARTKLYVFELAGMQLERIKLPAPIQGAAFRILDVSTAGQFLVEAERVIPEPVYLGLMVLELVW